MGRLTHRMGHGWTYFITTKTFQSVSVFPVKEIAETVVQKLVEYREAGNYLLHDFVLMPNHLHLILTPSSASLERCMQLIKGGSSFEIHKLRGGRTPIWQSGFHESRVTSWVDYQKKRDYVMFNPVAAKLVERPVLWPYGSASGEFKLDPIPQGLKPRTLSTADVGPKGPTPGAPTSGYKATGAKAQVPVTETPGLKPRPPKEKSPAVGKYALDAIPQGLKPPLAVSLNVGAKAPTPGVPTRMLRASRAEAQAVPLATPGLKPRTLQAPDVGPEGPTLKPTVAAAKP